MAAVPLNGPATSEQWRERISSLRREAAEVAKQFADAQEARRHADAQSILTGKPVNAPAGKLDAEEKASRKLEALHAAIAMAEASFKQAQDAEQEAEQKRLREHRRAAVAEMCAIAARVDTAFGEIAGDLSKIESLLNQHRRAGGRSLPVLLKNLVQRAAARAGAQNFLLERYENPGQCMGLQEHLARYFADDMPPVKKIA